jgi:hypothetical protein
MLGVLFRRASPHNNRICAHQADVRTWQPGGPPYDLVVTHFLLDCLTSEEVQSLATTLRNAVSPGSHWIVSEFAIPSDWFGRLVARPVVLALYRGFGWLTGLQISELPNHPFALREASFTLETRRRWLHGLLISELWSATRHPSTASSSENFRKQGNELLE